MKKLIYIFLVVLIACGESEEPQIPQISISGGEFTEGNTPNEVEIAVSLNQSFSGTVLASIRTQDGTAIANQDYTQITNSNITFAPGETSKIITIIILGESQLEEDETFSVIINTVNNAIIENGIAEIKILNDDQEQPLIIPETGYITPLEYQNYTLIWQDEFNFSSLNSDDWNYEIGGSGWGNNELQFYTDDNTSIIDGNLVIEARRENFGGREYTSSRLTTQDKFEFQYGRVDIRAVTPKGQGIWPALWMLGANFSEIGWPFCGEIDIMELVGGTGKDNVVHGTAHWQDVNNKADFSGSYTLSSGIFNDEFHVFSIIWDEDKIQWFVDDIKYHEIAINTDPLSEFQAPYFFIFNVAVGGNWPGSPDFSTNFPQRMIVDYIRVFQK